jgi:hypothetical protein
MSVWAFLETEHEDSELTNTWLLWHIHNTAGELLLGAREWQAGGGVEHLEVGTGAMPMGALLPWPLPVFSFFCFLSYLGVRCSAPACPPRWTDISSSHFCQVLCHDGQSQVSLQWSTSATGNPCIFLHSQPQRSKVKWLPLCNLTFSQEYSLASWQPPVH